MGYLKTGFTHIDKNLGGLKQGKVYFISALDSEMTRGFTASLCASINSFDNYEAILYTDSPIPYCRCVHTHFTGADEIVEFLRVDLASSQTHELTKTDVYFFEDFDLLSISSIDTWPSDKILRKHLYDTYLYSIKSLAEEYQVIIVLTDRLYENNDVTDGLGCDFPDIRYKCSRGTFHLSEQDDDILAVQFLDHHNLDNILFPLKFEPKKITQSYPAYVE